jgi:RNA polymerase sigma-70 factor (ECF subfamily)
MPEDSFASLMARLQSGDDEAAARVFRRFARRLIALAETHLSAALRQKEDAEDVVQSAFKSFFRRQGGRLYDLAGWDSLWSLLAGISVRKGRDRPAAFRAACRDVRREVKPAAEAFAPHRTPSEAAMLAETLQGILRGLERDRQLVVLRLQGSTIAQISTELGCTERTVYRGLQKVRKRLEACATRIPVPRKGRAGCAI